MSATETKFVQFYLFIFFAKLPRPGDSEVTVLLVWTIMLCVCHTTPAQNDPDCSLVRLGHHDE